MKEPMILFPCNHNTTEHSLKSETIRLTRGVFYDELDSDSPDMLSVQGTIVQIESVFQLDDGNNVAMYFNHSDYTIDISDSKTMAQIIWKKSGNHPADNSKYYVNVKFINDIDIRREIIKVPFWHSASDELITGYKQPLNIICIKTIDGIYYEGCDYSYEVQSDGTVLLEWHTNINPCSCTAICYLQEVVMSDNSSDVEADIDEDEKISMTKSSNIDCPRCGGTGWYVGLFENNCYRAKGVNKLLQDFVKLLYTVKADDGNTLLNMSGRQNIQSEEWVESVLKNIVANALLRYNAMIAEGAAAGKNISDKEKIYSAGVSDVEIYDDSALAKITIVTYTGYAGNITIDI